MANYILILIRLLFSGATQQEIYSKLVLTANTDNSYVVQTSTNPVTWEARDRTFKLFDTQDEVSDYFQYTLKNSTLGYVEAQIYDVRRATFTYWPAKLDIQKF